MRDLILLLFTLLVAFSSCGKNLPEVPILDNISKITSDSLSSLDNLSTHFTEFKIKPKELKNILKTYYVIPEEKWYHNYSHVAGGDRKGWIILKDGTKIKWLVRPAGLAKLTYPEGRKVYLAKELSQF